MELTFKKIEISEALKKSLAAYRRLKGFRSEVTVEMRIEQLSMDEKKVINYDNEYSNPVLSNWDASYQALMRGVIKQAENNTQAEVVKLNNGRVVNQVPT